eukprot:jgi/Chrzof1/6392/Cz18g08180.t1
MEDLNARLDALSLTPDRFVEQQGGPVASRVDALKELQKRHDELEEQFRRDKAELEAKYEGLYAPLYSERADIVSGGKEVAPSEGAVAAGGEDVKGIPDFWLTVLLRHEATRGVMNEKDPEVLRYLSDIQSETLVGEQHGFRLSFFFKQNPFFSNQVLTKTYIMLDDDEPVLEKSEGSTIDWLPGKNVTVKVLKKKPKKGSTAKPQTKTEQVDSFFNFFSPPQVPDPDNDMDDEELEILHEDIENDFDMGDVIRSKLIPDAVRWYTGEAPLEDEDMMLYGDEDKDDDEDGDDEDDDEDEGDADEDEEEDDVAGGGGAGAKKKSPAAGKRKAHARKGPGAEAGGQPQQECKQQ